MNAGTLTQALTASRYKANPTAGSREKQDDTVSFMDMFAQNLKDARKTGTKAADKKRDGAADSKAQEMGDTGRNQASVDQGKKSEPMEDGTCREDSKKAESGVENTDKDSDSGKRHNEGAAAEAINLQAMSLLMQEVPVPAQAGEAPYIQAAQDAAMLTEYVPEPGKTEQTLLSNTALAGHEQTAALQTQELVQPPYAEAVREQMAQETAARSAAGQEPSGKTSDTVRPVQSDTMEADMTAVVQGHKETRQSGEDMFSVRTAGRTRL